MRKKIKKYFPYTIHVGKVISNRKLIQLCPIIKQLGLKGFYRSLAEAAREENENNPLT